MSEYWFTSLCASITAVACSLIGWAQPPEWFDREQKVGAVSVSPRSVPDVIAINHTVVEVYPNREIIRQSVKTLEEAREMLARKEDTDAR